MTIGGAQVPLETDLTTYRAYTLSQSSIWKLGKLDFLAPAERIPSQLILNQPFDPDRIPVVLSMALSPARSPGRKWPTR